MTLESQEAPAQAPGAARRGGLASRLSAAAGRLREAARLLVLAGTLRVPAPVSPLPFTYHDRAGERMPESLLPRPARGDPLFVFLPGKDDRARDFVDRGLVGSLLEALPGSACVAADAHLGYYLSHEIVDRLRDDVVLPARAAGYTNVWLVGLSIGGLGAAGYAMDHPDHVRGLILLAPYLGPNALLRAAAGGGDLSSWRGDGDFRIFVDVVEWLTRAARSAAAMPILLGYGRHDRRRAGAELLARLLPPERVSVVAGGHRWPVWQRLWRLMLPGLPEVTAGSPASRAESASQRPLTSPPLACGGRGGEEPPPGSGVRGGGGQHPRDEHEERFFPRSE
ncbi:MAG: alpha/beta hydrolase [Candidatus Schekmanbacteria bacterium]|nr:alpha/beta hydrolase [Candidatus Schekmanbacteria bacterium]